VTTTIAAPTARAATDAWRVPALAQALIGWGGNQFTPMLIEYRQRAGYSQVDVDVLLGAYVVGLVPGLLLAAALSDRLGRRPLMLAGLAASILGSVVLATGDAGGFALLFAGRLLSGAAVGVAMAVGSSWVTELSPAGAGARRASVALSLGFAVGPLFAGLLGQWSDAPLVWPYVLQALLCVVALAVVLARGVETRHDSGGVRVLHRLRVPKVAHRRFLHVVLPMAPWIFGSAAVAYAIVPQLVEGRVGRWALLYTAGVTVVTLLSGVLVQPVARRLDDTSTARAAVVSMVLMTAGIAASVATAATRSPWLALPVALLLGAAFGIAVVSGLLEVQRIAEPDELAGLTGVYYSLAYVGFLLPAVLAAVGGSYVVMLAVVAALALACTLVCASGWSRHLPAR
jgi:MFS family permease